MSITERIAAKFGEKTKTILHVNNDDEQIIIYGAINLLQTIFCILGIVIVGAILGVLYEALIFSVAGAILRKYSGGVHASSSGRCLIMGTLIAAIGGIIISKLYILNIIYAVCICTISMLFTLIFILKNAPVDSVNKPINSIPMKQKFKKLSVIIVIAYSLFIIIAIILYRQYNNLYFVKAAECVALGSLWQGVTLTKAGSIAFNKGDFVLKYIMERK